jgi:hypothetical protein
VDRWIEELELEAGGERGFAAPFPPSLAGARQVVCAVAGDGDRLAYRRYAVRSGRRPGRPVELVLVEVLHEAGADPLLGNLAVGDLVLLDERHRPITPPLQLSPSPLYVDVPVRILTDAGSCRALVIPVGADPAMHAALTSGTYRFVFSIDRARWRAQTPDAISSYQASVMVSTSW